MKIQILEIIGKFITQISSGTPGGAVTGQVWYDSSANKFRGQKSTGPVDLEGGGGGGSTLTYSGISSDTSIAPGTFYGVDASSGKIVLTLADGTTAGESLSVKKLDATGNTITINGNMDGDTSLILSLEDESIDLYWNGTIYLIN